MCLHYTEQMKLNARSNHLLIVRVRGGSRGLHTSSITSSQTIEVGLVITIHYSPHQNRKDRGSMATSGVLHSTLSSQISLFIFGRLQRLQADDVNLLGDNADKNTPASWIQLRSNLVEKAAAPVWKTENTAVGMRHADHVAPSIRKSWH
jgi:hypothetical protein